MRPTVLDLFCGAVGGWSLGLHRAGYRTVAAAELDPWRRAMFAGEFPDAEMFDDVRAVTADALRARLGSLPDVVVGSPPCQDASVANHAGKGIDGARTGLFSEWLRIVRECRPVWCCAENVPGLARRGLERIVAELEDAGYRADVLDIGAQDVGAPHRRRRLWIIGTRLDVADADQGRLQAFGWPSAGRGRGPDARGDDSFGPGAGSDHGADTDETRLAVDQGQPGHHGAQRAALVGVDWLDAWSSWHGGCARNLELVDGIGSAVARPLVAAIGDAVMPQITEAIGRTMMELTGNS